MPRMHPPAPDGRTLGIAQEQPQAAVEPARLLCKALRARSSSVSALSRWTNLSSAAQAADAQSVPM
jgi:hypothetical protein